MIAIICGAVGIAAILIIYLPLVAEKKRQEEHQREIEFVKKRHDEGALVKLRANLMALESEMMRSEMMGEEKKMIEKLEYYRTAKTDRDGCAREWTSHPNLEDITDKINEIIEYLNRGEEDDID